MANELRHADVGTALARSEWEAVGGHILNSQAAGDIIYASSTSQLSRLGIGSANQLLVVNSGGTAPEWTSSPPIVTALVPDAADGATLGTAALEFSDLYLADAAVIYLGADQDVTLTHYADNGILVNSTRKLYFEDGSNYDQYIGSAGSGVTAIAAPTEIDLTAPTIDINASTKVDINGDLSVGDDLSLASDAAVLNFGADSEVTLTHVHNAGLLLNSSNYVSLRDAAIYINSDADGYLQLVADTGITFKIGSTDQMELTNGALTPTTDSDIDLGNSSQEFKDGYFDGTVYTDAINFDGTAISATAAELNIMDGVTSTTAELNLTDGNSSIGTTTVSDGHGIVMNHGGTMAQTTVQTLAAYLDDEITAMPNLTSVGTLTALTVDDVAINGKVITMTGSASDTAVITVATDGALTVETTDAAAAAANIQITADGTAELAGTTVTLDSGGGITLDADSGTITFADGGSSLGTITSSGYSGTAAIATAVTITDNESTNENNAVVFTSGGDLDGGNLGLESDGNLHYNPSTGALTATSFAGTFSGNVSGSAATVTGGTQTAITNVANVVEVGALDAGSITSGFGAIDNGTSNIRTATITAETAVVPDAASGATLGTTSLEWGHIYVGDDQKIYLGDGQDVSLEYDEDGTDQLRIAGNSIFENQVQLDKDLLLDSTPADTVWSGITAKFTAGEDLEDGECVYLKAADTKMWKAVANTGGTGLVTSEIMCVAMCVSDVDADDVGVFLLQGFIRADTNFPTYAIGETLYLPEAEVGGKNVPEGAAPDTDGDFVQVIGWAADANTVYFSPNFTMVEIA